MLRQLHIPATFDAWRDAARTLLADGVGPRDLDWTDDRQPPTLTLTSASPLQAARPLHMSTGAARSLAAGSFSVPRAFLSLAEVVACHRSPERWGLLYRVLHRIVLGREEHLLQIVTDDDVRRLHEMEKAVRRDRHKMTAFVRFRKVIDGEGGDESVEHFVAWHRPDHYIVRLVAPFFVDRFRVMRWTILTPDDSMSWDGEQLEFGPGVDGSHAPAGDDLEALWKTYYGSVFNPARIKLKAMRKEMPVKHWRTLPETQLIPDLLADAPRRVEDMMARSAKINRPSDGETPGLFKGRDDSTRGDDDRSSGPHCDPKKAPGSQASAAIHVPATSSLKVLQEAARECRVCDWACKSTQTVFGEGPTHAKAVFVGEQPGDHEDRNGRPFVGPAGQLLDEMMDRAGVDRSLIYVTNAVKHFKFEQRGTRRIHAKPSARDMAACRPWLEAELGILKPPMLVCLGSTAAQSLLGAGFRITQSRGEVMKTDWAEWTLATYHPSALLRVPDPTMKERMVSDFVDDLKKAADQMAKLR